MPPKMCLLRPHTEGNSNPRISLSNHNQVFDLEKIFQSLYLLRYMIRGLKIENSNILTFKTTYYFNRHPRRRRQKHISSGYAYVYSVAFYF